MNQAYKEYLAIADEIYYLNPGDPLTEKEIDEMLCKQLQSNKEEAPKFVAVETAADNWDGYGPQLMIDGDSGSRFASLSPTGDVEIILSLTKKSNINAMTFEQYVSVRNANNGFEIWAWDGTF